MLTESEKYFFECNGYLVLRNLLNPDLLKELRAACDEAEARWQSNPEAPGVRRPDLDQVMAILEYDPTFVKMLTYPAIFQRARDLLGPDIRLLDHDYFVSPTGAMINKGWHYDEGFPSIYHPRSRLMVKVFYVLEDIPHDGGGTVFLPGSHCFSPDLKLPNTEIPEDMPNAIRMDLPAGSAYLMHGRLYHSVGNNLSNLRRKLLIYTYGHKWMRVWGGYEPSDSLISQATTPMLRQLMGLTDPYGPNAEVDQEPPQIADVSAVPA